MVQTNRTNDNTIYRIRQRYTILYARCTIHRRRIKCDIIWSHYINMDDITFISYYSMVIILVDGNNYRIMSRRPNRHNIPMVDI